MWINDCKSFHFSRRWFKNRGEQTQTLPGLSLREIFTHVSMFSPVGEAELFPNQAWIVSVSSQRSRVNGSSRQTRGFKTNTLGRRSAGGPGPPGHCNNMRFGKPHRIETHAWLINNPPPFFPLLRWEDGRE